MGQWTAHHLPNAAALIAGRGYGSNCFRDELAARDFVPCIPGQKNRQQDVDYDKTLHKQRPKIENMFATPKDWRRIATRYDRYANTFLAAIRLAGAVALYLKE